MPKDDNPRLSRIAEAAETVFGAPVVEIETPGGSARASCRVILASGPVIATLRPNFRRTHLEALVLQHLAPRCDAMPDYLGYHDGVLFQRDVGAARLNDLIARADPAGQADLADAAVSAIFRYQIAARDLADTVPLPPLGISEAWLDGLVDGAAVLEPFGGPRPDALRRAEIAEALAVAPRQFVKWDCRSGNAAVDETGRLRWFDFEYCGMRHGPEDVAWLIADEVWPVAPDTMLEIVRDNHSAQTGLSEAEWTGYLTLYTTFHAMQRLQLIIREVRKRGWRSKARIRARDDVGKHPEFAANLCATGAFFADRQALTRPFVPAFETAERAFRDRLEAA